VRRAVPFDEAVDANGRPRPAYEALRRRLGSDPLRPPRAVVDRLREHPLGDDGWILPVPLALEESDFDAVAAGVAQRARALQRFFREVAVGAGPFLAGGGLEPPLLDAILATEGTSLERLRRTWDGHDPGEIRFVYAPDLARDPGGRWMVLEDNVGCVGGSADSFFVAVAFARAVGLPAPALATADLVRAVSRWLGLVEPRRQAVAVLGCDVPAVRENLRRERLLGGLGIAAVEEAELDGLLTPEHEPPGALVNFDHVAERLVETVFGRLRMPLLNSPGTGLLGNKALLPFVDEMIRSLCGEEPLLGTPPTRILRDGELPLPGEDWVVKTSTGAGGTGVLLPGSESAGPDAVRELVAAAGPAGVVAQRWVEPSTLTLPAEHAAGPYSVELRPVTYVLGWNDVRVGAQPVGKAVPSSGREPNTVSRGAAYVAVLREPS
jgi:uncharacterized circularly permuted ATP-grasp superfamily protein